MRSEKESKLKAKAALKGTSAAEYRYGLACETSMAASICCCLIAPAVRSTAISLQRCEGNAVSQGRAMDAYFTSSSA
jgi:hypothetical protein